MTLKSPTCRSHAKPKRRASRGASVYTSRWDRLSLRHRKLEPLCRECLRMGKTTPAAATDHIIPHQGTADDLFWDRSNHQSLCLTCHGLKSWRETQGYVIDWQPNEDRYVITGRPSAGKSWFARNQIPNYATWDHDSRHCARSGSSSSRFAAIAGHAEAIVTMNAQDFPRNVLAEEGLERWDPDGFLWRLWSDHPQAVGEVIEEVRQEAERLSGEPWDVRRLLKKARLPRLGKALS